MKERLKKLLEQRQKTCIVDSERVPSAVLLPVFVKEGQYHLLFIKRTMTVRAHKGQISFPGGAYEKDDLSLLQTALRECCEEIGLSTADAEVLGEMDDEITATSNYVVTPFIAMIPWPYRLRMNRQEVDEIIKIPIAALLDSECLRPDVEIIDGVTVNTCSYYYRDRVIWGATARILDKFLEIYRAVMRADEQSNLPPHRKQLISKPNRQSGNSLLQ